MCGRTAKDQAFVLAERKKKQIDIEKIVGRNNGIKLPKSGERHTFTDSLRSVKLNMLKENHT